MSVFNRGSPDEWKKRECSTADKFYDLEESQKRYQDLIQENIWLKQQMERSRPQESFGCPQCRSQCDCSNPLQSSSILPQNADMALWSMLERNKYLQTKTEQLRGQYEKQSRTLCSIRSSDKWRNRMVCGGQGSGCYEDKYLQLLRVRSPFY